MIGRLTPIALTALLVAGCSSGESNPGGDSPHPLGTTADVGGWNVTVQSVNLDAESEMLAVDATNVAAPAGEACILLNIALGYVEGEPISPYNGAVMSIIGGDGIEYATQTCGIHPDDLIGMSDMRPGATVEGVRTFRVPDEAVSGAELQVQDGWSGSNQARFSIQ